MKRWTATITYRSNIGSVIIDYDIEELDELAAIVEAGPDWNTIENIRITLNRVVTPGLTIEQADAA